MDTTPRFGSADARRHQVLFCLFRYNGDELADGTGSSPNPEAEDHSLREVAPERESDSDSDLPDPIETHHVPCNGSKLTGGNRASHELRIVM